MLHQNDEKYAIFFKQIYSKFPSRIGNHFKIQILIIQIDFSLIQPYFKLIH